jgi:hypothetical protein
MGDGRPALGAAGASQRAGATGDLQRTDAAPPAQQSAGNQLIAQAANQAPSMPEVLSLKGLAHARTDTAVVQQQIDRITHDLSERVIADEFSQSRFSEPLTQSLVNEGIELQRSADFADQSKVKIWSLRVLSWIGSVVSLGVLPGLAQLIAPKSDFADSLSRYLLGNNVDAEKLQKFEQLFEKLQEFHGLVTRGESGTGSVGNAIAGLISELEPQISVPAEGMKRSAILALNETFRDYFVDHKGEAAEPASHWVQDYRKIAGELLTGGGVECIPGQCWFRKDGLRDFHFTLTIGDRTIRGEEMTTRYPNIEERRTQTMQEIVDAVCTFARDNELDPEAILGNLLRTYQGQSTAAPIVKSVASISSDEFSAITLLRDTSRSMAITIGDDGSCCVSQSLKYSQFQGQFSDTGDNFNVPCDIQASIAYESSLDDFTNGGPPRVLEDQCTFSGHYLDMGAMA